MLCWLVGFAAHLMNRSDIGSDGKTALQRLEFESEIWYMPAKPARGGKWELARKIWSTCWHAKLVVKRRVVVTERGVWRSRHVQRTSVETLSGRDGTRTEYSECDLFRGLQVSVTVHSTFQVGMERPAEMVPRPIFSEQTSNSGVSVKVVLRAGT